MANSGTSIAQLILEQIRDFKTEIREDLRDLKTQVSDTEEKVEDVKSELSGKGGCSERISRLETQMSRWVDNSPGNVSIVPAPPVKSKTVKDHLPTAGAAAAVVALAEIINAVIKGLGK
jgi:hypothetical protein